MKKNLLNLLKCPESGLELTLEDTKENDDGHILAGFSFLTSCGKRNQIKIIKYIKSIVI